MAALYAYWLPAYRSQVTQSVISDQQSSLHALAMAARPFLQGRNLDELNVFLNLQRQMHAEWQHLQLYDANGRKLYPAEQTSPVDARWQVLQQVVESNGKRLGRLALFVDNETLLAEKTAAASMLMNGLLGLMLMLAVAAAWWQEFLVRRPLSQLVQAASSIARGDYSAPLPTEGKDEIGLLAASFSAMRTSISAAQWKLKTDIHREAGRAQAIMDNVLEAVITIDAKGIISSFNPAAERIFGYARDEAVGRNVDMLMPEPERSHHDSYIRRYCETGKKTSIGEEREILALRKDGCVFPAELSVNVVSIEGGISFSGIIRDITQRKQIEAELAMQRHQIETINSAQSRFIAGGDPVAFFEGVLSDILELTESEYGFIGEVMRDPDGARYLKNYAVINNMTGSCYEQHAPQDLTFCDLDSLLDKAVRTGEQVISNDPKNDPDSDGLPEGYSSLNAFLAVPVYFEKQLLGIIGLANRPNGYDASVVKRLSPVLNTCAQIFSAIGKDRQQRHTALALKRSNSFMSALVENLQAALLVEDEAGRIHMVNQLYCDMFTRDDMPLMIEGGDCVEEFAQIQALFCDPDAFLRQRQACLQGQHVVTGEALALKDGRVFEQGYVPIIFEDEQGQIHRSHLWSYHDISEHKRVQKTLGQAKEAAEAAARAKSQFLATMSHEIRTPMNGVLGMLHLLQKTGLDATQQRYVATASGSGEMLLEVINDILDFSKLEADKLALESIPFELVRLMEESISLLASGAQQKGIELLCSLDRDLPGRVRGDPVRLRQVLINLINNAIKFTERGEIELYAGMGDDGLIRIGVRDTGIGMTEAQQQHLFKAFSQVDSSHTRKYGGTGLGLAICQKLITAMGGKISVSSTPGIGSDFSFELSMEVVDAGKRHRYFSAALARQKILVVEDNATSRLLLQTVLEGWQVAHVGLAEGGADALKQLQAAARSGTPYDIAILDLLMPDMDGLELARHICADATLRDMRLMMFSALDQDNAAPELDAWLTKPMRQSELFNTLLQLIGEQEEASVDISGQVSCREWWFGGRRLLLVEDNLVNQEVAKEILGAVGFDVDIQDNGVKAVQAVKEYAYDVVLMDIQMPVMDGLQATREIRRLGGRFTALPIIAMTAHALSGDAEKSLAAGMNAHVTKPIDPEALFLALSHWVDENEPPPAVQTENEVVDIPGDLPGIDVVDGLQRLNGNWSAYKRILLGFRDKQAGSSERLAQMIEKNEWSEAARLAHTLKGSAGNLGAKSLYESASAVEQACRQADASAAAAALGSVRGCLAQVVDGLAVLETQTQVSPTAAPVDFNPSSVHCLLDELAAFLDTDLGAAQAHLEGLRQQLAGTEYAVALSTLESALNSFDIDAAKVVIREMQVA